MRNDSTSRTVYTSEAGRLCPGCGHPVQRCACKAAQAPQADGAVRIMRQTKGRKGKGVCLVQGLPLDAKALGDLARRLKQRCGAGGSVKDGVIEIQGDHRDTLLQELKSLGYSAKLAGG